MISFESLEWVHDTGVVFKLTYDEPDDWSLEPHERDAQSVLRIRRYLHALSCRQPRKEAA